MQLPATGKAQGGHVARGDTHFLFFTSVLPLLRELTAHHDKDRKVARVACKLWTNFARTANPTPNPGLDSALGELVWDRVRGENRPQLAIDSHRPLLKKRYDEWQTRRAKFWTDLINKMK